MVPFVVRLNPMLAQQRLGSERRVVERRRERRVKQHVDHGMIGFAIPDSDHVDAMPLRETAELAREGVGIHVGPEFGRLKLVDSRIVML